MECFLLKLRRYEIKTHSRNVTRFRDFLFSFCHLFFVLTMIKLYQGGQSTNQCFWIHLQNKRQSTNQYFWIHLQNKRQLKLNAKITSDLFSVGNSLYSPRNQPESFEFCMEGMCLFLNLHSCLISKWKKLQFKK